MIMNNFCYYLLLSSRAALVLAAAVPPSGVPSLAPAFVAVPAGVAYPSVPLPAALGDLYLYSCPEHLEIDARYEVIKTVVVRVSATLSILGSSYMVAFVWKKWRRRRDSLDPYQRIMAAYSVYDILLSFFAFFLGPWMVPAATGWWGAAGNATTCSVQGFFYMFGGFGSVLSQIFLSLQMMLLVSYDWRPSEFERKIEYRMHWCILVSAFIFASALLIFQGYTPECGYCNASPLPAGCGDWLFGDGTTECLRGSDTIATIYLVILGLLLTTATVFCTGAMVSIYRSVYRQEQANATFAYGNEENHTKSKSIRTRMLLYTSTFYICWIFPAVFVYVPNSPPPLRLLGSALGPLMGFLNVLVFILPRCGKYQREHAGTSLPAAYFHVLFDVPITAIARWITSGGNAEPEGEDPRAIEDDGIGLGRYNEQVERPAEDSGGEHVPAAGDANGAGNTSN